MGNQRVAVLEALHDHMIVKAMASIEKDVKELKLEMKGEMEGLGPGMAEELAKLRRQTRYWIAFVLNVDRKSVV